MLKQDWLFLALLKNVGCKLQTIEVVQGMYSAFQVSFSTAFSLPASGLAT
jgi:hypothetical protein